MVISKSQNFLYVVRPNSTAMRYTIGMAPDTSEASGLFQISRKDDGSDGLLLGDTKFRIKQTTAPITIGRSSPGSGFQLVADDFSDLYKNTELGTRVVVAKWTDRLRQSRLHRADIDPDRWPEQRRRVALPALVDGVRFHLPLQPPGSGDSSMDATIAFSASSSCARCCGPSETPSRSSCIVFSVCERFHEFASRYSQVQSIRPPIGRRRALHQIALFELVDQSDEIRALDAERITHLILPQSGVELDDQQRGILRRRNPSFAKHLLEAFEGRELRAAQRVTKTVGK